MTNTNVRPWIAPALFPALMVNPLAALYVCMSHTMLRLADVMDHMTSSGASERQDNRSVLHRQRAGEISGTTQARTCRPQRE